ncbi:MAG TPA: ribbon-helix-helix protein, CopG family [Thermoanaerobaculia bacterium]|jgi:RHH-type rel operon transcriptional repressor/antitoxin RelB|nr:ribbon-helix-helix protein, CopG family [Thermoanaerobaculia bacterium]
MSIPFSVRLPEEDAKALEKLAAATDRSKSYLVQKAVENYLAEHEDYRLALDRLHDPGDSIVSAAELRKSLAGPKTSRARR